MSVCDRLISSLPLEMRVTSSRSSISISSARTFLRISSTVPRSDAGSSALRSSECSAITTGVSGVRSSCERMARKRSLAWLAASASARALRLSTSACTSSARLVSSACSAARAWVWSRKILSRPIGCVPSASRIAIITPLPQKRVPFFLRCQRSSAARPSVERLRRLALRRAGDAVLLDEDDVGALADDLVGDVAEQALGADVPAGDAPLQVEREDRVLARVVDDQAQPLLRLAQRLLGVAPVADVEDDRDRRRRPVVGVEHRRHRRAHPDDAAVAAHVALLHLERRAVAGEAAERLDVPGLVVGMDERERRRADQRLGRAPGDQREAGVGERDPAVEVEVGDAGRGLRDDGAKERLRLAQRFADAAPLADVDEGEDDAADPVLAAAVGPQAGEQPALAEADLALDRHQRVEHGRRRRR